MSTPTHPLSYRVLSLLLDYPEQPLIDALPELDSALADVEPALCAQLAPLFAHLGGEPSLIALQETYVGTFDRQPSHSLHLFEHLHGEDRAVMGVEGAAALAAAAQVRLVALGEGGARGGRQRQSQQVATLHAKSPHQIVFGGKNRG